MKHFDCESQESTIYSLCSLLGCSADDLLSLLQKIDLERIYQEESPDHPPAEFLYRKVISAVGPHSKLQSVCWFHLTRTYLDNKFEQGILPLGKALDSLWETMLLIFEPTEHHSRLQYLRSNGVSNYHYGLKVPNPFYWGPYAMLIRDTAFSTTEMGNHDYLWLPEIIEDICNGYLEKYGISIHEEVVQLLTPCVVKFKSRDRTEDGCIRAAIYYIYKRIKGERLSIDANTCFDAKGNTIPSDDILKIEYLGKP